MGESGPLRAPGPVPGGAVQDPLEALNDAIHTFAARAKEEALTHSGPVLVVTGARVLLFRDGARVAEVPFLEPRYARLKEVAHVAQGVQMALVAQRMQLAMGEAFFGDPMRMHVDVMATGAMAWLDTHPPNR
ncbi:MAG: hypothetical protein ABSH53_15490 [Holophaga sp.]